MFPFFCQEKQILDISAFTTSKSVLRFALTPAKVTQTVLGVQRVITARLAPTTSQSVANALV